MFTLNGSHLSERALMITYVGDGMAYEWGELRFDGSHNPLSRLTVNRRGRIATEIITGILRNQPEPQPTIPPI